MATSERSAKALVIADIQNQAANISALRGTITTGAPCTANNVNTLIGMINNMLGHYHTYDDYYSLKTYGNTGSSSPPEDKNTDRGNSFPSNIGTIDSSTTITAAKHNEMAGACRTMRQHSHNINDRTS